MQPNNTPEQPTAPQDAPQATPPVSPQVSNPGQPQGQPPKPKSKLGLIIAGIILLVGIGVALWLAFGGSKSATHPALTVGQQPYIYACSVVNTDTLTKNLGINNDKSKQAAEEVYAFAPFSTKAAQIDVLKETGRSNIPSTCKLRLDITPNADGNPAAGAAFTFVGVTVQQYADAQAAKAEYEKIKNQAKDAKSLPSFADSSFYTAPTASTPGGPLAVSQITLYKNMTISYSVPVVKDDTSGEKAAAKMDLTHKDVLKRIDAGEGNQPKNYSAIAKVGDTPFYDACQNTDFSKIGQAIGADVDFDITLFTSSQQYMVQRGGGADAPEVAVSICNNYFRTKEDVEAQSKLSKAQTEAENFTKYPHIFMVQVLTTKNSQDAQKVVENFKKSGENPQFSASGITISDVALGDKAIKVFTPASSNAPQDGYLHYIAKDNHVYAISILMTKQSEPYKTSTTAISDDQMKRIYEALVEGVTRSKE